MDAETSEVARAARASAGLVLLQLLLYRFPPLLEVDADGNTPLHYAARYDPGLVDAVMIALGDEWARAATLANRHGHIPKDMLTPAVEHLDAATALAGGRSGPRDRLGPIGTQTRDEPGRTRRTRRERRDASGGVQKRRREVTKPDANGEAARGVARGGDDADVRREKVRAFGDAAGGGGGGCRRREGRMDRRRRRRGGGDVVGVGR